MKPLKYLAVEAGYDIFINAVPIINSRISLFIDWPLLNSKLCRDIFKQLHSFPEGKIEQDHQPIRRVKWGSASLIVRAPVTPIVLPIVHSGFEKVLGFDVLSLEHAICLLAALRRRHHITLHRTFFLKYSSLPFTPGHAREIILWTAATSATLQQGNKYHRWRANRV
jgi:hypothetical protein